MRVESGKVSVYSVPTDQPEESDGTAVWSSTTIVVVELTAGNTTGLGFTYSNEAAGPLSRDLIRKVVLNTEPFDIPSTRRALDIETRNMGRPGLVSTVLSAVDISLWDLKARLLNQSVLTLLGRARNAIPAYGSGGFTSYTEKQLLDQLTGWASEGLKFVKMKIGRNPEADVQRVAHAAKALGGKAELFVDANGAYSRKQALHKSEQFAQHGVAWFEEPVSSDDRIGLHMMVEHVPAIMDIAAGEYSYTLDDARGLIDAQAVDVMQADVTRCGGVSNFLKIANACEMYHLPLSAHTAPSVHATLCCAVTPAIHVEYFHDHARIERMFFDGAIAPERGNLKPDASQPGFGLALKRTDAERFLVSSSSETA